MRPDPPKVLMGVAVALMADVAPGLSAPFAMQSLGIAAGLLGMAAEEFDRAASRLVEEDRALVVLFERAAPVVASQGLASRLREAAARLVGVDLRVSALQRDNDVLRALLLELHVAIEAQPGADARALEEAIWDELRESTRRRHFSGVR
jgi:hypothetical protein